MLTAAAAKKLAESRLTALWTARTRAKLRLSARGIGIRPGGLVRIEGEGGVWKVGRWLLERMEVALDLVRVPDVPMVAPDAAAGSAILAPDLVHGPTTLRLLDLPLAEAADRPSLFVLAGGDSPGWRSATVLVGADDGLTWRAETRTAQPAVLGTALGPLGPAGSALVDADRSVEVALLNDSFWLESCSDAELAAGANLALLGSELMQFGRAEPLGGGRFRLSRLLRGRRGTEAAAWGHGAGEPFALLEPETMLSVPIPLFAIGAGAVAIAAGIGDPSAGVEAELMVTGEAVRPPSPVHLAARERDDGALAISWVRRSRMGWTWTDDGETPLSEEREHYAILLSSGPTSRSFETSEPRLVYALGERHADGIAFPVTIAVRQVGTFAVSRPAQITFG